MLSLDKILLHNNLYSHLRDLYNTTLLYVTQQLKEQFRDGSKYDLSLQILVKRFWFCIVSKPKRLLVI